MQCIEPSDHGITLSLPVNDDREIMMKILQYGSQATVLSPRSLQLRLQEEITKMQACYQN
jgi:predicted DNA-binding transcriptional regulator YafY